MTTKVLDVGDGLDKQLSSLTGIIQECNSPASLFCLPSAELGYVRFDEYTGEHVMQPLGVNALNATLRAWAEPRQISNLPPTPTAAQLLPRQSLPKELVQAYMESGNWTGVPPIKRFAPAPLIRPDWTIAWDSGYDLQSHVYVSTSAPPLPEVITEEMLMVSKAWLSSLFHQFALVHKTSRADCLALMLTPLIMDIIPNDPVPAGVFKADKPGSGKTKLAELISLMAMGKRVRVRDLPSGGEMMKTITSILKSNASPVALFDNVKSDLSSSALEALITGRSIGGRLLGQSVDLELRNDTMWLFSVNSPSVSTDMLRRCVFISLSPDTVETSEPWTGGPIAKVEAEINNYRSYLVSLVQWWIQQGGNPGSVIMSGFEEWSKIISGIFEAAGIGGFLEANVTAKDEVHTEASDDSLVLERIMDLVNKHSKDAGSELDESGGWFLAKHLEDLINDPYEQTDTNVVSLRLWATGKTGAMGSRTIGKKLADLKGRALGGLRLDSEVRRSNKTWYHVEVVDRDALSAAAQPQQRLGTTEINDLL